MPPQDPYALHSELIEKVLVMSCRVHRLLPDHADEFCSWVRVRLLDDDRAILRKFAGRSSLRTYLVTVIERLFLDWRNHEWGKWRPSSEARRLGEVAIELERLVLRDGIPFDAAAQALLARGQVLHVAECDRVWARLPRHPRRQRADETVLDNVPSASAADPVEDDERRARARAVLGALTEAIAALPAADQQALRLRYWSGVKVARIAELSGEDAKTTYRRLDRLRAALRERLGAVGVDGKDLDGLFDARDPDADEEDNRAS